MRSYEEIREAGYQAIMREDQNLIRMVAEEALLLETEEANAFAQNILGTMHAMRDEHELALEHYRRAAETYKRRGERTREAHVLMNIGNVHGQVGQMETALEYYAKALDVHTQEGNSEQVAAINYSIGNVYVAVGDYPRAISHFNIALNSIADHGNNTQIGNLLNGLGIVYADTADYPLSLEHHYQALEKFIAAENPAGIARTKHCIGCVYSNIGDVDKALEYIQAAAELHAELGERANIARAKGNLGTTYARIGNHAMALEFLIPSLELHREIGDADSIALALANSANSLLYEKQYDSADKLLRELDTMQMRHPATRIIYQTSRAVLLEVSNDLEGAKKGYLLSIEMAVDAGLKELQFESHILLRDLAQKQNDFAGYIEHNNAYQRISEEITGKESTHKLAVMEMERRMESERRERDKERALLYGTLPKSVAERKLRGEDVSGDHYDNVAVIFVDIVGFTALSDVMSARDVVQLLQRIFTRFDEVCNRYNVTKIKTIGDSYLAVRGLEEEKTRGREDERTRGIEEEMAIAAIEILQCVKNEFADCLPDGNGIQVRIGVHCGPVTAGVLGTERLQYDVWGDTVNVASRLESTSEPNRIHISEALKEALHNVAPDTWHLEPRGLVEIKGKGFMHTFWLDTIDH